MKRFAPLMLTFTVLWAADYPCDVRQAFTKDPASTKRAGYLTSFNGLGLSSPLVADLNVTTPYSGPAPAYMGLSPITNNKVQVVGVIEDISWAGGAGDPISLSCYMSQENAHKLQALKKLPLKTTAISSLGWWVGNYDKLTKKWFEEMFPISPKIGASLLAAAKNDVRLNIADEPASLHGVGARIFNVHFEVMPAANVVSQIHLETKPGQKVVKPWGIAIGIHPPVKPHR
jgi:hypothetical protein